MSNVELNEETRERLDKYVEERGAFPLHLTCETYDDLINGLLDKIERLEDKCERIETQSMQDREALFDAVLIGIQTDLQDKTVSEVKRLLVVCVNKACNWTGNNQDVNVRRLYELAEEHNKTRRYDNGVFQWRR